jgi:CRP-like cAMP-binding protein
MNSPEHDNPECPTCRIQEALSLLQRLQIFKGMPLEILKLCAYLSTQERYQADEPILLQGEASDRFFMIMEGEVDICEQHGQTHYLMQQLSAKEFNYFGELALIARFKWFFSAWARTDVTLLSLSREAFQKVCTRYPEVYPISVEQIVHLRINRFVDQMETFFSIDTPSHFKECTPR